MILRTVSPGRGSALVHYPFEPQQGDHITLEGDGPMDPGIYKVQYRHFHPPDDRITVHAVLVKRAGTR